MSTLLNHLGFRAGQHVDDLSDSESFFDSRDAGQNLLSRFGSVFDRFDVGQANITRLAIVARIFLAKIFH